MAKNNFYTWDPEGFPKGTNTKMEIFKMKGLMHMLTPHELVHFMIEHWVEVEISPNIDEELYRCMIAQKGSDSESYATGDNPLIVMFGGILNYLNKNYGGKAYFE